MALCFKYMPQPLDAEVTARNAAPLMDVVTTSGAATGKPISLEKLQKIHSGCAGSPVAVASGITLDNIDSIAPYTNVFIVGTCLTNGEDEVHMEATVRALQQKVNSYVAPTGPGTGPATAPLLGQLLSMPAFDPHFSKVVSVLLGMMQKPPELRRKVVCLTGAGVSVTSGIPDFRSAGGMYETLRPSLLTATAYEQALMASEPSYVVSWDIFKQNPFPYLEVRRPFILGSLQDKPEWKLTLAHVFFQLLDNKGLLLRLFTQNIDGLDFQLDLPKEKIIPVHGTIGIIQCESCEHVMGKEAFVAEVKSKIKDIYKIDASAPASSTPILCPACGMKTVKPATVLYGRGLPAAFFEHGEPDMAECELLFVVGTSLTVMPAAGLPSMAADRAHRVLVNRDLAGGDTFDFGSSRDIFLQGDCDSVFLRLIMELGLLKDVLPYLDRMCPNSRTLVAGVLGVAVAPPSTTTAAAHH